MPHIEVMPFYNLVAKPRQTTKGTVDYLFI